MKITVLGQDFYLPDDNSITNTAINTSDEFMPILEDNGDKGDSLCLYTSLKGCEKNKGQGGQGSTDKTLLSSNSYFPSHTGSNRNNPIPPIPNVPVLLKSIQNFSQIPAQVFGQKEGTDKWLDSEYKRLGFFMCNDILPKSMQIANDEFLPI
jgi:hypothetical protein